MGYLDSLNITGSALTAERFRTDIIMQNLANQNTTRRQRRSLQEEAGCVQGKYTEL